MLRAQVMVYRSKPNVHTAPGGYWYVRLRNADFAEPLIDVAVSAGTAQKLIAQGATQLPDGGERHG